MAAKKIIPIETWERRDLFRAFLGFYDSTYSVSAQVDILPLYRFAKENGHSFFLLTLFAVSKALNAVPAMRQRFLDDGHIVEYETIAPATPIMVEGKDVFNEITLPYRPTFKEFRETAEPIVARAKCGGSGRIINEENIFCASCVPWFEGAALTPACCERHQALQVFTWFKMTAEGKVTISCRFSHCFVDGWHIGLFYNGIAENFRNPEML